MSFGLNPLCPMADEVQHLFSCFSRSDSSSARGLRQSFLEDLSELHAARESSLVIRSAERFPRFRGLSFHFHEILARL